MWQAKILRGQPGRHPAQWILLIIVPLVLLRAAISPAETVPVFDKGAAFARLEAQCAFGPRVPGSDAHLRCRDYLLKTLSGYSDNAEMQPFRLSYGRPPRTVDAFNIIAKFRPELTGRILLCAHWDSRPWADEDSDPKFHSTPVLGANDGASGVAVLLEMARIFQAHPPPVGIDLVLFDGEDAGDSGNTWSWARGSQYFAGHLAKEDYPKAVILLDMIGDRDLAITREAYSLERGPAVMEKVWGIAAALKIKSFLPERGPAVMDDHIPFLRLGIPAIDLIDLDYPHWHTSRDTPDKCSPDSLDDVGRVLVQLVYTS
ncbi:MAG: M28 family peptidase [Candidatus Aminicenantales bacterium]